MFERLELDSSHYLMGPEFDHHFQAQTDNMKLWSVTTLGQSERGQNLNAYSIGRGKRRLVFAAGHHSDEPLGPHTLRQLILQVNRWWDENLDTEFSLDILPHVNPDGEKLNETWLSEAHLLTSFGTSPHRELPGRDMEFAYPDRRPENLHLSRFFKKRGPVHAYANLHGMLLSEGALLLMGSDSPPYKLAKDRFSERASRCKWKLHDHDRGGEKGFCYFGPGFTSTPSGQAMSDYFKINNDDEMASRFGLSSMEVMQQYGNSPLLFVSEIPLFRITCFHHNRPGLPKDAIEVKAALNRGEPTRKVIDQWKIEAVRIREGAEWQLNILESIFLS